MEIFIIRALQFILAISLLVLLHEGGHFFFARLFGVRVEKFFLFFDPGFHLFQFKPKNSDTTYGIGWLPLGGYCKIAGMVDESFDTEQLKTEPQPWEMRTKPAWQRLFIMAGGVLVNFFLALFIYAMVLFYWGDSYIAMKDMTHGMKFNSEAQALGLQDGDILVGSDQGDFKAFDADFYRSLATAKYVSVIREGQLKRIDMPGDLDLLAMLKSTPRFVEPLTPAQIDTILPQSPAMKIGMQKGDRIVAFNGKPVQSYNEFLYEIGRVGDELAVAKSSKQKMDARKATITYIHAGDTLPVTQPVLLTEEGKIGAAANNVLLDYKKTHISYGFFESFPAGAAYGINVLKGYVGDMKYLFSSEGAKSIGGFGAIGSLFPPVWDWHIFWLMTAFLSIILAFMNILPIPALDGGHILFIFYEMITRRKPSENFMVKAEYVGFAILMTLMIWANLNDVLRWIGIQW